ncbi:transcription elongation factor TFIIS [Ciborinia camelliae]|nr:transcription elongation factor TFIIS [Ciborinia camelliae]
MDQRELTSRVSALQKAINDKEPAANVITIMETLKRDVNATEELLRATKAGMVVAKQRGNANKDIAKLATEIVTKWKKTVEVEKDKRKAKLMATSGSSPAVGSTGTSSPAPAPSAPVTKTFQGDSSKRRWETDKVDTKRTGLPTRDACIGLMYNGLAFKCEEPSTHVIIKAMAVEQAAYDHFRGETKDYKDKLRSLFQNLKQASNTQLRKRVMSGDIEPARFVAMTHEELKSEEMKKKDDALELENMKKAQVPMAEKSISDALTCGKCQQKKVSYSQAQTRSADEPMTTFCECQVCGHRWKVRIIPNSVTIPIIFSNRFSVLLND